MYHNKTGLYNDLAVRVSENNRISYLLNIHTLHTSVQIFSNIKTVYKIGFLNVFYALKKKLDLKTARDTNTTYLCSVIN